MRVVIIYFITHSFDLTDSWLQTHRNPSHLSHISLKPACVLLTQVHWLLRSLSSSLVAKHPFFPKTPLHIFVKSCNFSAIYIPSSHCMERVPSFVGAVASSSGGASSLSPWTRETPPPSPPPPAHDAPLLAQGDTYHNPAPPPHPHT